VRRPPARVFLDSAPDKPLKHVSRVSRGLLHPENTYFRNDREAGCWRRFNSGAMVRLNPVMLQTEKSLWKESMARDEAPLSTTDARQTPERRGHERWPRRRVSRRFDRHSYSRSLCEVWKARGGEGMASRLSGARYSFIGPDGAGQRQPSGARRCAAATSGEVTILGQPAREARSSVGYLTQAFSLYPDLSVAENLRYVGELRRLSDLEIDRRARHYLSLFDMERFMDRLAGRLSGGMKQKLALACALITEKVTAR
jgi:energy-coupling factor transporter ATP-binding protein EcfA2